MRVTELVFKDYSDNLFKQISFNLLKFWMIKLTQLKVNVNNIPGVMALENIWTIYRHLKNVNVYVIL